MKILSKFLFLFLLIANISQAEIEVCVDYFYSSNCTECEKVGNHVKELTENYRPYIIISHHNLNQISNYHLLVGMEEELKSENNEPLVIFVGSNYLCGAESILSKLDSLLTKGISNGGVSRWRPKQNKPNKNNIKSRFDKFTWPIVIGAGLVDGINPCAFATLIFFASMLACYRKTKREILLTTAIFAIGVGLTYGVLGLFLFSTLRYTFNISIFRNYLRIFLFIACFALFFISLRDAYKYKISKDEGKIFLKLPDKLRNKIHHIFHKYTGKKIAFGGVFFAGVVVSLMESVCTGQMYIPTLAIMARQTETHFTALSMLLIYNLMFILPLFVLAFAVSYGVKSLMLTKLLKRNIVASQIIQGIFFLLMGILIFLTM